MEKRIDFDLSGVYQAKEREEKQTRFSVAEMSVTEIWYQ